MKMTLLGDEIEFTDDFLEIDKLWYLTENPRVYACIHRVRDFSALQREEQQELIQEQLLKEPSVANLIPEIRRHRGLIEPILVRHDTMEVIEGNSRLAVYRHFRKEREPGDWEMIPCHVVSSLSDEQSTAYLNQIHVKGKTQWSAYEKANFAYVRKDKGWNIVDIARLFGVSQQTIRKRIRVIELMIENDDQEQSRFNHYNLLVTVRGVPTALDERPDLRSRIMDDFRIGSAVRAQDLRRALPGLLSKPKVLNRYIGGKIALDEACRRVEVSQIEEKVRWATALIDDVTKVEVAGLEPQTFAALKQNVRKLVRGTDRVRKLIEDRDAS